MSTPLNKRMFRRLGRTSQIRISSSKFLGREEILAFIEETNQLLRKSDWGD
jgi:hypothetical protein